MSRAKAVSETSRSTGLKAEEVAMVYVQMLHNISTRGAYSDSDKQAMADVVREFYDLLTDSDQGGTATQ